ncbi:MAG: 1,4-dihydroxy-2-naphthoate polyprenyltransferase [Candidatus Kapabacteria bacterium]|nr:1,4-dihydroxy-2-naphthoate polyprenyltransferase [Candidatus Kapabacteria bacterium]
MAIRPKSLPAGIMPVIIGASIAYKSGKFNLPILLLILFCSISIQIITNFVNDLYDAKKGADTKDRLGPQRTVASGLIKERTMFVVCIVLTIITFLCGLYLVSLGGRSILIIGIVSLIFAWLYTAGPLPIGYLGLGDLFVFIFFGLVATGGTYFLLTGEYSLTVFIASTIPGFISVNILQANNIRDIDTDKLAKKYTLAVRLGRNNSILLFILIFVSIYISDILLFITSGYQYKMLLMMVSIPYAYQISKNLRLADTGKSYINVLEKCFYFIFICGLLLSISFLI